MRHPLRRPTDRQLPPLPGAPADTTELPDNLAGSGHPRKAHRLPDFRSIISSSLPHQLLGTALPKLNCLTQIRQRTSMLRYATPLRDAYRLATPAVRPLTRGAHFENTINNVRCSHRAHPQFYPLESH